MGKFLVLLVAMCFAWFGSRALVLAAPAPDGNSVLILGATVGPASPSLEESKAMALGYTVVVASNAVWAAMTASDFASYKAIVLGDRSCSIVGTSPDLDAALANRAVWAPAITGNIVVVGTDPTFHSSFFAGGLPFADGDQVAKSGISFAASEPGKTGAYIALACYYHDTAPGTPVPILDKFGSFTVTGVGCFNDSHIVAVHPALSGLTDASLSGWSCSVHEAFDSFPSDFLPLAIAEGIMGPGSLTFADGTFGIPYIIARGEKLSPILCGNGILEAPEECDDGNLLNGDGCSSVCKKEIIVPPTNNPPDCSLATTVAELWPPNHKMMNVAVSGVTDPDGDPVSVAVTSVMQDEPTNTLGDGNFCPDGAVNSDGTANLRAERSGTKKVPGDGRVYHLNFMATDSAGASCKGEVKVCVPHDQRPGHVCVDQGSLYDSTVCAP